MFVPPKSSASGPLSAVKMKSVSSAMPSSSRVSSRAPVYASICISRSAHEPFPDFPTKSGWGSVGKCVAVYGR
jgi:hypothetical protein